MRNKFSSLQQTVLSKTCIFLSLETKNANSCPDSRFLAENFKKYRNDRTKTGGGFLFYVNENLLGKITNSYNFKESSEIILFECGISNKMWLPLGNYAPLTPPSPDKMISHLLTN